MAELSVFDPGPQQTRGRRDTSGRTAPGEPIDPEATYSLYLWDHEAEDWDAEPYAGGLRLMALRRAIRAAEDAGWSEMSYLVSRD